MGNFAFLCCIFVCLKYITALSLDCPVSGKMLTCSPKCKTDSECPGQKCCTNICNTKSCTQGNQLSSSGQSGYKSASKGATGSYCGNVKCNSYEKCELDRATKREKCVRA